METIFGEVEVLPDEKSDGMKAIEVFRHTADEVRGLDFVTKDKALKLVHQVLQSIAIDLANENIVGAMDAYHKMHGAEEYIKRLHKRQQVDLETANILIAGRISACREIGGWIDKQMMPSGGHPKEIETHPDLRFKLHEAEIEAIVGLRHQVFLDWRWLSRAEDEDFIAWIDNYLATATDELTLQKAVSNFRPQPLPTPDDTPNLISFYKKIYNANKSLRIAWEVALEGASSGDVPRWQTELIFEQTMGLIKDITTKMKQIGELY